MHPTMGSIELRMTLLLGMVAGVLMVLAELVAMHRKVAKYRDHLRALYHTRRYGRLLSECLGLLVIALIQPVIVSLLVLKALDNFDPRFSRNAVQELQHGVENGNLNDNRHLRGKLE
jgi:hypothetical protein